MSNPTTLIRDPMTTPSSLSQDLSRVIWLLPARSVITTTCFCSKMMWTLLVTRNGSSLELRMSWLGKLASTCLICANRIVYTTRAWKFSCIVRGWPLTRMWGGIVQAQKLVIIIMVCADLRKRRAATTLTLSPTTLSMLKTMFTLRTRTHILIRSASKIWTKSLTIP